MSAAPGAPDERPGVYVHVPFCSAICPYCDFAVRVGDRAARRRYGDALLREIDLVVEGSGDPPEAARTALHSLLEVPISTLYFGGGTPSLLGVDQLARLVEHLRARLPWADDVELFLEANPEDLAGPDGTRRLDAWRALGVEFLSLGVQSLDDDELRFLGRRHTAAEARAAVARALDAGFATVNVDLIYGLPGGTNGDGASEDSAWHRRLDEALAFGSHHLSLYELEIHERTVFGKRARRGELVPASEARRAALFRATHRHLLDAGWDIYEVSNFARDPSHRSRHNQKYWRHVPYLGLGPSSHSYAAADGTSVRWWNERSTPRWQRHVDAGRSPIADAETLNADDLILETLMLGLRTTAGVDLARLETRTGIDLRRTAAQPLERSLADALVTLDGDRLLPTLDGMAVADALAAELTRSV